MWLLMVMVILFIIRTYIHLIVQMPRSFYMV